MEQTAHLAVDIDRGPRAVSHWEVTSRFQSFVQSEQHFQMVSLLTISENKQ